MGHVTEKNLVGFMANVAQRLLDYQRLLEYVCLRKLSR